MKDIVITSKEIRRELCWLLICFILAELINAGAIIAFERQWIELVSQAGYLVFIAVCLYLIFVFFRCLWALVRLVFKKKS